MKKKIKKIGYVKRVVSNRNLTVFTIVNEYYT